jgi:hypothetical protein
MRASSIGFVLLLVGCVDKGDEGMFVLNNSAPTGTMCAFTSDPAQAFLPSGVVMAGFGQGYAVNPLVQSRIDATVGHELERTIHLEGANVILSTADSSGKLQQSATFTALFAGSVPPLASTNVSFELVSAATVAATTTTTEISASITVFGSLGGGRIEAEPFNYPVEICVNNCLATNPMPAACGVAPAAVNLGNPCNAAQDFKVDCCMGATGLVCPSP